MEQKTLTKERIFQIVRETFPNNKVLLIYYCGSVAYGLEDELSDIDVTVVLEDFRGHVHLCLGSLDIFAYGQAIYQKREALDSSIPLYYRASIDDLLSKQDNLIYLNESYRCEYDRYKNVDLTRKLGLFLSSFIELNEMRLSLPDPQKSHYHILRIRGILDHLDRFGKYDLEVNEPWNSMMKEYKKNWNTEIGINYMPLIREQLNYIIAYRDKVMKNELG